MRAEFVQAAVSAEIPVVRRGTGSGVGRSGVILQRINVRNGPGAAYESLGILNPKDVVSVLGRDAGGRWVQIEFVGAPNGVGWLAAEFIEVEDFDLLPLIGTVETPVSFVPSAVQDGDSLDSPIAQAALEAFGARALQVSGEVSAPQGDSEDWIGFSAGGNAVVIEIQCAGDSLRMELWNNGTVLEVFACGERRAVEVASGGAYHLRLFESGAAEPRYTRYVVKIKRAW